MRLSAPVYHLKRRAKMLARNEKIPLHQAQDRIARDEGFAGWSLLSRHLATGGRETPLLRNLADGDMLLIAARPGQGKTRLGLQLVLDAAAEGRRAVFFTLDYTERQVIERLQALADTSATMPEIVTAEEISADYIARYLAQAPRGTVAVIDYLQILDQQRNKPPLSDQMRSLQAFARGRGVILGFISQIDRNFDPESSPVPGIDDLRLPNPVPDRVFSKACFRHGDETRFQHLS